MCCGAEKGFIIVGQDTDGTVTPHDAGMSWAIGKKKEDFVGMRSLARPDLVAEGRKQLVGLMPKHPKTVLEEGAQIVMTPDQNVPMDMVGHVTSSYWSETLGAFGGFGARCQRPCAQGQHNLCADAR